jgi:hypothetical protein
MNTWRLGPVAGNEQLEAGTCPRNGQQAVPRQPGPCPITLSSTKSGSRLPQSKHGHELNALTCAFAPPAGLEPATYGLGVRQRLSASCRPGASPQVESGLPSGQSHPGRRCDDDRIAKGIARSSVKQRARRAWLQSPVRKRSASIRVKLWPVPSRRIGWPACHEEAAVADSGSRSTAPTRKQRAPSAVKALAAARSTTPPVAGTT